MSVRKSSRPIPRRTLDDLQKKLDAALAESDIARQRVAVFGSGQ